MSKNVATSDYTAHVATITRSGQTVILNEKALENQATAKCDKQELSHHTSEQKLIVSARENVKKDDALQSIVSKP